jgi:uncharacterized damage-inducible protein DinB
VAINSALVRLISVFMHTVRETGRRRTIRRVPDLKPPRHADGELETLLALLQYQRESLARKVEGLASADVRRSPVASGTSLLWLIKHVTRAETLWVCVRFRDDPSAAVDDTVGADETAETALAAYQKVWATTDAVVRASDLDDIATQNDGLSPVNLRWILMHLLEETARHAGHADILRELIDGSTGR